VYVQLHRSGYYAAGVENPHGFKPWRGQQAAQADPPLEGAVSDHLG
jgi:hypothetical protein